MIVKVVTVVVKLAVTEDLNTRGNKRIRRRKSSSNVKERSKEGKEVERERERLQ